MKLKSIALVLFALAILPSQALAYSAVHYTKPTSVLPNGSVVVSKTGMGGQALYSCSGPKWKCSKQLTAAPLPHENLAGLTYTASANNKVYLGKTGAESTTQYWILSADTNYSKTLSAYKTPSTQMRLNSTGDKALFILPDGYAEVVSTSSGTVLSRTALPGPAGEVFYLAFSPTGKYAAYMQQSPGIFHDRGYVLLEFSQITGKSTVWTQSVAVRDLLYFQNKIFDFDPAEQTLYFMNDQDGFAEVYGVSLTQPITAKEASKVGYKLNFTDGESSYFTVDNNYIYVTANTVSSPTVWNLYKYNKNTKSRAQKIADGVSPYVPFILTGQDSIAFQQYGKNPGSAAVLNIQTGKAKALNVSATQPKISEYEQIKSGPYVVTLGKPSGFKKGSNAPVVVWLHGGPYRQVSLGMNPADTYGRFDYMLEQLRKNGAVIAKADFPGSSAYGTNSYQSLQGQVGKIDVDSVMKTVSIIKQKTGATKIYLMGISYGGYLGLKTAVEYPTHFSGVIAISPVTDWSTTLLEATEPSAQFFNGLPNASNANLYKQADIHSKATNLKNMKVLLSVGEKDVVADPKTQAEILAGLLKQNNASYEWLSFAEEGHVFNNVNNLQQLCTSSLNMVIGSSKKCR